MRVPEPYSPATVATIRERAGKGQSDTSLAQYLGWEVATLRTVARRHGIEVFSNDAATPCTTAALTNGKPAPRRTVTAPANEAPPIRITITHPAGVIMPAAKPKPRLIVTNARRAAAAAAEHASRPRLPSSQVKTVSLTAMMNKGMADRVSGFEIGEIGFDDEHKCPKARKQIGIDMSPWRPMRCLAEARAFIVSKIRM